MVGYSAEKQMFDEYFAANTDKHQTSCYLNFVFQKRAATIANVSAAEGEEECD